MTDNITLRRWANANEDAPETEFQRGYDAARRWVREVALPALAEPELQKERPDFLSGYYAGLADGRRIAERAAQDARDAAIVAAALAEPEQKPEPSGYAYRYNDGVLRFNDGTQINGARPIEALPYFFAPPAAALVAAALAEPDAKPEPVAFAKNGNLFWCGDASQMRGVDIDLYPAPPKPVHPGYIIGAHWLETAYSRIAAGEAEDAVLAEVLGARGWAKRAPATDVQVAEAYKASYDNGWFSLIFFEAWREAERFHGITKEGGK